MDVMQESDILWHYTVGSRGKYDGNASGKSRTSLKMRVDMLKGLMLGIVQLMISTNLRHLGCQLNALFTRHLLCQWHQTRVCLILKYGSTLELVNMNKIKYALLLISLILFQNSYSYSPVEIPKPTELSPTVTGGYCH